MIFPQPKLTKKIKSINKNPRPPDRKELGPILTRELKPKVCPHIWKRNINELTALTKDKKGARNKIWSRSKGRLLIVLSNAWWLDLFWNIRTSRKIIINGSEYGLGTSIEVQTPALLDIKNIVKKK